MKPVIKLLISAVTILGSCKPTTDPNQLINYKASLRQTFKLSELHQKVITNFINKRKHTTSILYGNGAAYAAAVAIKPVTVPGESFTLVTWRQQDDQHWFGALIPGDLLSAETLKVAGKNESLTYNYQKYSGKNLGKLADTTGNESRIKFILSQKASITP
jgi:hypothetical protein